MSTVDEIKQRIDPVELIQGYVKLTPAGTNHKARCPFHQEKSPSFMVSREKGIWHCFGCGKGGDIFTFLQEMEGMDFPEALRVLAERAGVELHPEEAKDRSAKLALFDCIHVAQQVYHKLLLDHDKAAHARAYLKKRGVSDESIASFHIGYAPESWEGVSAYLKKRGFTDEHIFKAGLTVQRDKGSGYYDRFRNRLMFPIADHLGRTIGFGGRALADGQDPKYVNTPQTALYNKSAVLFAIDRAKQSIKTDRSAIIVEGYMDALAAHQAGTANVVAASGTALTLDQLRLLKRFTTTISLAFDTDVAGSTANFRGIDLAWQEGFDVRVLDLGDAKDPDELIQKNPGAWTHAVTHPVPYMDYAFAQVTKGQSMSDVQAKKSVTKRLLPLIARLADPVEQTHYLQQLADLVRVREDVLRQTLPKVQPVGRPAVSTPTATSKTAPTMKTRQERIAEQLLALASAHGEHLEYLIDHCEPELIPAGALQNLYKSMVTYYTQNQRFDADPFLRALERDDQALASMAHVIFLLGSSDLLPDDEKLRKRELLDGIAVLKRLSLQEDIVHLQEALGVAERSGHGDLTALTEQVTKLTKQLADLQDQPQL